MRFVVTGGMGFFGSVLAKYLIDLQHEVLVVDRLTDYRLLETFKHVVLDIEDLENLKSELQKFGPVDGIFHVAAVLGHDKEQFSKLWSSNVTGTKNVMEVARQLNIPKVVFTSTNCVYSTGYEQPVDETTPPNPIEDYGKSKLEAEKVILSYGDVNSSIIRCPTIISSGRLGLLTILFDFIKEERKIYLVGDGSNKYSFIYALDLANACYLSMLSDEACLYHISSDNVPSLRETYAHVAANANKKIKFVELPESLTVPILKTLYNLGLSPLGPYHYRMLSANFVLDNTKIKSTLDWKPTKSNSDMLCEAYNYYVDNYNQIQSAENLPTHKLKAKAGILNLLRLIS